MLDVLTLNLPAEVVERFPPEFLAELWADALRMENAIAVERYDGYWEDRGDGFATHAGLAYKCGG